MPQNKYQNEKLITLAAAKKQFGYTSDHLAYLCRQGFIWAQRQGRTWLTCQQAIEDYKAALKIVGKPVRWEEQSKVLGAGVEAKKKPAAIAVPPPSRPPILIVQAKKSTAAVSRAGRWLFDFARRAFGVFSNVVLSRFFNRPSPRFQNQLKSSSLIKLAACRAPARLPVEVVLPSYLQKCAWYQNRMAIGLLLASLSLGLGVLAASLPPPLLASLDGILYRLAASPPPSDNFLTLIDEQIGEFNRTLLAPVGKKSAVPKQTPTLGEYATDLRQGRILGLVSRIEDKRGQVRPGMVSLLEELKQKVTRLAVMEKLRHLYASLTTPLPPPVDLMGTRQLFVFQQDSAGGRAKQGPAGPAGLQGSAGPAGSGIVYSSIAEGTKQAGTVGSFTYLSGKTITGETLQVTSELAVTNMTTSGCDVKANTQGGFYCGTDATGASVGAAWQQIWAGSAPALTPTTTSAGIFVRASSTIDSSLRVNGILINPDARLAVVNATSTVTDSLKYRTICICPLTQVFLTLSHYFDIQENLCYN